ncbi:hypothetical protein CK203_082064 [Vitis vinifera]|uniref:Reverse transcriptase Ty1/copia-type domain-containing protein n=1 Tax=Vitis vinifera TaxID=29760 RepID=A0A438E201_VITVI|nr:hypothetical protein CK203_082064 [Vitis vinifera]
MFGSKRALIRLQIAACTTEKGRRPQIAAWYHQKGRRTLPKHVQDWGGEKSSRSFAGKTVWRATGQKSPKEVRAGLGWENQDVGRLVGVRRSWRRRRVVGKRPHAPSQAGAWRSPPGAPLGVVGVGKDVTGKVRWKICRRTHEALSHPSWRQAMVDEMAALHSNGTWDLCFTSGKSTVGCRWVYAVKVDPDGQVDALRPRLVAKAILRFMVLIMVTHSPLLPKIASVRLLLSMAAMWGVWFSVQVTPFSVWLETNLLEHGLAVLALLFKSLACFAVTADHSIFYHHNSLGQCIYLVVYVDDIVITAQSSSGVVLSQRKYALDILKENRQFLQSPCDSHWDAVIRILRYIKSTPGQGVLYENRVILRLLVTQMQIGLAHP